MMEIQTQMMVVQIVNSIIQSLVLLVVLDSQYAIQDCHLILNIVEMEKLNRLRYAMMAIKTMTMDVMRFVLLKMDGLAQMENHQLAKLIVEIY